MKKSLTRRVKEHLLEISPESKKPKSIAQSLNANHGSVKGICARLYRRGEIDKEHHGFYRTFQMDVVSGIPYETLRIHGIKIECHAEKLKGGHYLWEPSWVTTSHLASPEHHLHKRNKGFTTMKKFLEREARITIHFKAKVIEVFLKCGGPNEPLDAIQFLRFLSWVNGLFPAIAPETWVLTMFGWNVDYHPFRLEGHQYYMAQAFANAWVEVYQKTKDTIRLGAHVTMKRKEINPVDSLKFFAEIEKTARKQLMPGIDLEDLK